MHIYAELQVIFFDNRGIIPFAVRNKLFFIYIPCDNRFNRFIKINVNS